jgi:hypothetical protein
MGHNGLLLDVLRVRLVRQLEKFSPPHSVLGLETVIPACSLKVAIPFLGHHC